jgi:aminoglycoside phosphotransferase (APT) family kinase protein
MPLEGAVSRQGANRLTELPAGVPADIDIEGGFAALDRLREVLTLLVDESGYPKTDGSDTNAAVLALFDWEFASCRLPAPQQAPSRTTLDMKAVLERSTRARGGDLSKAKVTNLTALHGGFGKNTTLFEVTDDKQKAWRLVSRAMQDIPLLDLPAQDIGKEFHMLRYAFKRGIRAAEPLWLENDKSVHGVRFLVSRQVPGRNLGSAVSAEPLSGAQVRSLAQELVKIHKLQLDGADPDIQRSAVDAHDLRRPLADIVRDYLKFWYGLWTRFEAGAYPVVEATFKWLFANVPPTDDVPVFLHGDYALHNILIDGDKVGGILDWEMYHIGDRSEDVSWLLSSIGKHVTQDEFMGEYLAAGGRPISNFQLRYYEVLVHLKLMIVALESQLRVQQLPHAGPHFCILGLGFIQHPAANLERAIREAEAVR